LLAGAGNAVAEEGATYTPEAGDEVIIYKIRYKPEDFEKGKIMHVEELSKALSASGQSRVTYFLVDNNTSEIASVSFFKKGHSVDEWHSNKEREKALEKLEHLLREPITFERFTLIETHRTD